MTIDQHFATVTLAPYIVAGYMPQLRPELTAIQTSYCSLTSAAIDDAISDALSINMGSTARWLADPATLVDHGDGTFRWGTSAPTGATSYWEFLAANLCVTDSTYAYRNRHDRVISKPAFIFQGDMWAQLKAFTDPLASCTLMLVARLRRPYNAHRSGIVESRQSGTDPASQSDVYLRLRENHVRTGVKSHMRQDLLKDTRRPQLVGASHGPNLSRLIVLDNKRTMHQFHHPAVTSYDMTWFLGRLGGTYDIDHTTVMDVLEINVWDSNLNNKDLRQAAHKLNGIYGVLG